MRFDPKRNVYIQDGHTLTPQQVRDVIEHDLIEPEKQQVEHEAAKVLAGTLTVAAFFQWLRGKVQTWHAVAGTVAYGGESRMTTARWKAVNQLVGLQLDYLHKFQVAAEQGERLTGALVKRIAALDAIPDGLGVVAKREVEAALMTTDAAGRVAAVRKAVVDALADSVGPDVAATIAGEAATVVEAETGELLWAQLTPRAKMYSDATYATFERSVKQRETDSGAVGVRRVCVEDPASCEDCPALATDEYVSLEEIADIGEAQCLTNCRCYYEFSYLGVEPLIIDPSVYA